MQIWNKEQQQKNTIDWSGYVFTTQNIFANFQWKSKQTCSQTFTQFWVRLSEFYIYVFYKHAKFFVQSNLVLLTLIGVFSCQTVQKVSFSILFESRAGSAANGLHPGSRR